MVLVVILHSLLILFLIYKLYQKIGKGPISRFYYPAIFFKISAGIGIGWVYLYYYQLGDTLLYHHAASYLADQALAEPQIYLKAIFNQEGAIINGNSEFENQPRAFLTVKILSVIHIITYKNYWLSTIYFSLFSFYGFWMLTTKLVIIYPKLTYAAIIAFLFFPSVVFWSSGITKESLSLGAMTFLVASKRSNLDSFINFTASKLKVLLCNPFFTCIICYHSYQVPGLEISSIQIKTLLGDTNLDVIIHYYCLDRKFDALQLDL